MQCVSERERERKSEREGERDIEREVEMVLPKLRIPSNLVLSRAGQPFRGIKRFHAVDEFFAAWTFAMQSLN